MSQSNEESKSDERRPSVAKFSIHGSHTSITSDSSVNREEARDHPGPLPTSTDIRRGLRRNSISMPELNSDLMGILQDMYGDHENNEQVSNKFYKN